MTAGPEEHVILVDAHVHIYDCFDLPYFLDRAYANFQAEAHRLRKGNDFTGILLLTETSEDDYFRQLCTRADNSRLLADYQARRWRFHHTAEACSLLARSSGLRTLILVAGRQIITKENLEALALGTDQTFADGNPLKEVIHRIKESGGIPALPWGCGKWWGRRGELLADLLEAEQVMELFLGDNSGRPAFWPYPTHFKLARRKGIRILPGTDPLPFPSESWRVGSFGFILRGRVTAEYPARNIRQILLDPSTEPKPYGRLERAYRFFRNQARMQLRKRRRRALATP